MAIGIGIGLPFRRNIATTPAVPSGLSASFTVDTISGDLTWTDNSGGTAQYEVYSSYNGNPYVFLGTTAAGATSYIDTTCKQNASVVYRIRAKKDGTYSKYVTTSVINTPLCWKTNQSQLTTVTINNLNIGSGSVTINWGDNTSDTYSGVNTNITKNYTVTGLYNISFTGNLNNITNLSHIIQSKSYGDITNWILPTNINSLLLHTTAVSGDISNWSIPDGMLGLALNSTNITGGIPPLNNITAVQLQLTQLNGDLSNLIIPSSCTLFFAYSTNLYGKTPQIAEQGSVALSCRVYGNNLIGTNTTTFRKAMTEFNITNQKVVFPTIEVDKFFKAAADWYQVNAPTANCTYNLSGANMGIPTDGVSNVDIVRLIGYYSAAGFAATVLVRTS